MVACCNERGGQSTAHPPPPVPSMRSMQSCCTRHDTEMLGSLKVFPLPPSPARCCRPTTTKMLGNLKVFTIALLMRTVMQRRFNVIQWEALFLLVAGGWRSVGGAPPAGGRWVRRDTSRGPEQHNAQQPLHMK